MRKACLSLTELDCLCPPSWQVVSQISSWLLRPPLPGVVYFGELLPQNFVTVFPTQAPSFQVSHRFNQACLERFLITSQLSWNSRLIWLMLWDLFLIINNNPYATWPGSDHKCVNPFFTHVAATISRALDWAYGLVGCRFLRWCPVCFQ